MMGHVSGEDVVRRKEHHRVIFYSDLRHEPVGAAQPRPWPVKPRPQI